MLSLQVLGPIVLRRDGAAMPITVRKTLALLVVLALGGSVPRTRAAALLWPTLDESMGRRNLRRELARLRTAGATEALHTDGDRLALAPAVAVDARSFEQALQGGDADAALAHWGGTPADGLALGDADAFDDWLGGERVRLLDLRRQALETAASAAETRSDHGAAMALLQQLLGDDPLQESHHRSLMRLQAAAGHREAALAQYQRCTELLRTELGLAPMAETVALAAALRGADPAIDRASSGAPQPVLPERLPFVGRHAEVAALEAAWHAGSAVLIEGEAGVGKSRLALDIAAAHGSCAVARCRPGDDELAFAAFARALRAMVDPGSGAFDVLAPWARSELARLLPELGPTLPPIGSAEERSRFFEACALAWQALPADDFDVLVLDDWHLADADSRALLIHVAQRRREDRAAGVREWILLRPELAAEARQRLQDGLQASAIALQPLAAPDVLDLVRRLSGSRHPVRFANRLQQATGGSPFFLTETLRHLVETQLLSADADGVWQTPFDDDTQDYAEMPMPASVRDAVVARVQRLGGASHRVLEAASLASDPFAPALLAPACALSELDVVLAIEQAVQAHLLQEHEQGGFAFAHDLIRQAIDAALTADRRRLVHRRLALGAEATSAHAAVIAGHHEASGDHRRAVAWRLAAGDEALQLHALPQAIDQWRKGLADQPSPIEAVTLHRRLVRACELADERDAAQAHAAALCTLADQGGLDASVAAEARIAAAASKTHNEDARGALALLEQLPAMLDDRLAGQAAVVRVDTLRELGRIDDSADAARSALKAPGLPDADRTELLGSLMLAEHLAGNPEAALVHANAAMALSVQLGDRIGVARGHYRRGVMLMDAGDRDAAALELGEAARQCEQLGIVGMQRAVLYNLCVLNAGLSRPADVLASASAGWALRPALPQCELRAMYHLAFVEAHTALGDLGAAWDHVRAAITDAVELDLPQAMSATLASGLEVLAVLDEGALAQPLLDAINDEILREMPQAANEMWIARAQFELMRADPDAAARALDQVDPAHAFPDERVHLRHRLARAELALVRGDAIAAAELLPAADGDFVNEESRLRALALRVQAEAVAGALDAATLRAVESCLRNPPAHALATLALTHALTASASGMGLGVAPDVAEHYRDQHARLVARLAESLQAQAAQRQAFRRRWAV